MEIKNQDGLRNLLYTILNGSTNEAPFDSENEELTTFLNESAYLFTESLQDIAENLNGGTTRKNKARIRYLSALIPDASLHQLANSIHYVMGNPNVSVSEIRDIIRGEDRDIAYTTIQQIGKGLKDGKSLRSIAKDCKVSYDTVERIENFVGIAETRRLKLVDVACDAVRENWSVRKFATVTGVPKSSAHRLLQRAKEVLKELGEL